MLDSKYLCEHDVYYRELGENDFPVWGEYFVVVVGVHQGVIVSERRLAVVGNYNIYRLVNVWNGRNLDWKYFVK